ncbi:MAG: 4Fe-4S binding protein [Bacilli bacterium]|nr:4Fe-4S binding protein [Bacilli bacterium]
MDLTTKFDGLVLKNPLMPAAGPLVGDAEKMLWLKDQGLGGLVAKTISTKDAHIPHPCIIGEGNNAIFNCELWTEYPKEKWINEFLPELKAKKGDTPLILSVGYTKEDMEVLIPVLDKFADAFEVSCHYVGTDHEKMGEVVRTIRSLTTKPFYMKISPHIPDPAHFAKIIKENGANGVVAINSLGPSMVIDVEKRQMACSNDKGFVWMSGPVVKPLALATVYTIKQAEPSLTVIGVGGVASAKDVIEFLLAGASAVGMLSAPMLRGKGLYKKIIDDLPNELAKYGFSSVQDVINTHLTNMVTYEHNMPKVDPMQCSHCGMCERNCPYFAIRPGENGEPVFNKDKCFRCGLCASKCPTKAIKF